MRGYNELVAIRDIKSGEEITIDYSLTEWSDDEDWAEYDNWTMACACGSTACRKTIREFCFLPEQMQKERIAQKRVQDFIVEKYKKLHGT